MEHVCGARLTSVASRPTRCGRDMVHLAHEECLTQYPPGQMYRDRVRPTWRAHQGAGHMARRVPDGVARRKRFMPHRDRTGAEGLTKTELAAGLNSGEMPCGAAGRTGRRSKLPRVFSA